jgi:(p)ppGpp synthase/HD superfamily hydrolase
VTSDQVTILTDRFDRALLYATHVHGGQARKGTSTPYLAHLLAVAATVLEYGGSEDRAIAGLLHDAAEDQGGEPRLADIRNRFGDRVANIVHACSDSIAAAGQQKEDWRTRKMRYIEHLKTVDRDTRLVSLSDKVHNARSILRDLRKTGNRLRCTESIWETTQRRHALVLPPIGKCLSRLVARPTCRRANGNCDCARKRIGLSGHTCVSAYFMSR